MTRGRRHDTPTPDDWRERKAMRSNQSLKVVATSLFHTADARSTHPERTSPRFGGADTHDQSAAFNRLEVV